MKTKVVIYARYSSDKQTEQSIEGQLRVCYEYAEKNEYMVVGEYIDRALTGTTDKRPEFLRMIEDSKKKMFNYVIVYQLDRFARNRYDSATYKAKLAKNGVRVLSARENISDDASGVLMESVLEGMAEYYSKELSQKTKRGMKESVLKGRWTGGYLPYGYNIADHKFVVNEYEANIIRKIFNDYINNTKIKDIVEGLNNMGIKNKCGKPFCSDYISRILQNKRYIGILSKTYETEEKSPKIIDEETFNLANEKLKMNKGKNAKYKADELYYLSGKTICGYCGSLITADSGTNHSGKIYKYYKCSKRKKKNACKKSIIQKDLFESKVIDKTIQDVFSPKIIDKIAENIVISFNKQIKDNPEIISYERQLNDISKKIQNIMNAIEQGIITVTTKEKLMQYESDKANLETRITKLKTRTIQPLDKSTVKAFLHDFENRDYTKPENKFRLLEIFINKIYLYDDYAIIVYNGIKDSSLKIDFCNKKTEPEQKFGFGSFGSPSRVRTYGLSINSRVLHH